MDKNVVFLLEKKTFTVGPDKGEALQEDWDLSWPALWPCLKYLSAEIPTSIFTYI